MKRNKLKEIVDALVRGMDAERKALETRLGQLDADKNGLKEIEEMLNEPKQKPFKKVWKKFKKTLSERALHNSYLYRTGRNFCKTFYNYKNQDIAELVRGGEMAPIESLIFVPFLNFISCEHYLIDGNNTPFRTENSYLVHTDMNFVFSVMKPNRTIQRVKP